MSRPLRTTSLLAAGAALAACADDPLRPERARPARVALALDSTTALASLGDTARVTARVLDAAGRPVAGAVVRWSLAGGAVARDGEGVYRAVANGRATVVAEVDVGETGVAPAGYWARRVADSVTIDVRQRAARLAIARADTAFRTLGARRLLAVAVTDARGHALLDGPPPLAWRSADPGVVAVDAAGLLHSVARGSARVTVQAGTLSGAATFTVNPTCRTPRAWCSRSAASRGAPA
jgi:hypothetical protein